MYECGRSYHKGISSRMVSVLASEALVHGFESRPRQKLCSLVRILKSGTDSGWLAEDGTHRAKCPSSQFYWGVADGTKGSSLGSHQPAQKKRPGGHAPGTKRVVWVKPTRVGNPGTQFPHQYKQASTLATPAAVKGWP